MLGLVAVLLVSQLPLEHVAHGVASYYTVASSGSRTASGDPLNDKMCTCAMRKAQLGSYVLVVADNGNSVICRVNDRGPFVRGRIVDLSEAAMRRLHGSADLLKVNVYKLDLGSVLQALGLAQS
jgi:rare lipoprotein A